MGSRSRAKTGVASGRFARKLKEEVLKRKSAPVTLKKSKTQKPSSASKFQLPLPKVYFKFTIDGLREFEAYYRKVTNNPAFCLLISPEETQEIGENIIIAISPKLKNHGIDASWALYWVGEKPPEVPLRIGTYLGKEKIVDDVLPDEAEVPIYDKAWEIERLPDNKIKLCDGAQECGVVAFVNHSYYPSADKEIEDVDVAYLREKKRERLRGKACAYYITDSRLRRGMEVTINYGSVFGFESGYVPVYSSNSWLSSKEISLLLAHRYQRENFKNESEASAYCLEEAGYYWVTELHEYVANGFDVVRDGEPSLPAKEELYYYVNLPILTTAKNSTELNENTVQDNVGVRALMIAAAAGNAKMITYLLSRRAVCNLQDGRGKNALFYALENKHVNAARVLLENGSDPFVFVADHPFPTSLHLCIARPECSCFIQNILKRADDVGYELFPNVMQAHHSPFLFALMQGDLDSAQALLEYKAKQRQSESNQQDPFEIYADKYTQEIIKAFKKIDRTHLEEWLEETADMLTTEGRKIVSNIMLEIKDEEQRIQRAKRKNQVGEDRRKRLATLPADDEAIVPSVAPALKRVSGRHPRKIISAVVSPPVLPMRGKRKSGEDTASHLQQQPAQVAPSVSAESQSCFRTLMNSISGLWSQSAAAAPVVEAPAPKRVERPYGLRSSS